MPMPTILNIRLIWNRFVLGRAVAGLASAGVGVSFSEAPCND